MKRRIVRVFSTLMMAFAIMLFAVSVPVLRDTGAVDVYADATVGSWADLGSAVGSGGTQTITLSGDFAYNGTSIVIEGDADITIAGDATILSAGLQKYESMFVVRNGGKLTIQNGVTLSAKTAPDSCPTNITYTATSFTGAVRADGKTYDPKGFFIHVEEGGTATLNGTLSDFVTSRDKATTPRYVAPVVAYGNGATFNLGTSGVIKNNLVGYIVKDEMANNDAQTIKQYVKGAPPNVPRVPNAAEQRKNSANYEDRPRGSNAGIDDGVPGSGITATAGAVIYKDGAKGTVEGTIENNRGDTGGVMASGSKTSVNIKGNALITKNVGVQFGGGSTVEQGGGIYMSGGTMSKNVAWFGGGAVYATENGVDWLLGRLDKGNGVSPDFDARKDGEFLMDGGEMTENTAFTRGGAVLADSDGVNIQRGKLTYNMGRMLGGAMYVMGDHPKYEYTVQMTGLYVHDNAAVSGEEEARNAAKATPDSGELLAWKPDNADALTWDHLNAPMQTLLKAPEPCSDSASLWDGVVSGGRAGGNTDDWTDGVGAQGTGGGVWLCAYGNTIFDANSPDEVIIADNWATGAPDPVNHADAYHKRLEGSDLADAKNNSQSSTSSRTKITGGSDFHADTGNKGTVVINGLTRASWINENTDKQYLSTVSNGRLNLVNTNPQEMDPAKLQVEVYGNLSRHGGGLASNGTYIFGTGGDQATPSASIKIEKEWLGSAEKKPVTIQVTVSTVKGDAVLADVPLDGTANAPQTEFDSIEELAPTGNTWNGRFALPMSVEVGNETAKVYTLVYTGDPLDIDAGFTLSAGMELDPLTYRGKLGLGAAIKNNKQDKIKVLFGEPVYEDDSLDPKIIAGDGTNYSFEPIELRFDEVKDDGTGKLIPSEEYNFMPGQLNLDDIDFEITATTHYRSEYDPETGKIVPTEEVLYSIYLFEIPLTAPMTNDNWPITEKYVNKQVHDDIVNFDQDFEYDILAYVPADATEFTISDTLVKGLEFADQDGNPTTDPKEAVRSIKVKGANNHLPGEDGTVSDKGLHTNNGNEINFIAWVPRWGEKYYPEMSIDGSTLSVTFNHDKPRDDKVFGINGAKEKWVPGRWVQVTFGARIRDDYRTLDDLKALEAEVSGKTNSWENDSTDKQAPGAKTITYANGDLGLVAALITKVGEDPVIWAVPGPSRLFARTSRGNYYATPMGDLVGGEWHLIDKNGAGDDPFGSNAWIIADGRYNGRSPYSDDSGKPIDLDSDLLVNLNSLPEIVGHTLIKGAEGGSRLFVMTEDAEDPKGTHIFTTPNEDKSGATWYEITEANGDVYRNAIARLTPDAGTIRMLDLNTTTTTLNGDSANWPVISEEEHEGMANQGTFNVTFGNGAKGKYMTNTVTVSPEAEELEVTKIWAGARKDEIPGPEDFKSFLVLKANDADVSEKYLANLTVTDNQDFTFTAKWTGLPKLKNTAYSYEFDEKTMPGFTTEIDRDTSTITNTKKREEKPEIEKYVNQAVHKDIELDEVFTYDIIAFVTKDADSVTITDKLNDVLAFKSAAEEVKVVDLGEEVNHLVTNNIKAVQVNDKASVAADGINVDAAEVTIDGQTLKVHVTNKMKVITERYDPVEIEQINPNEKNYYEKKVQDSFEITADTEIDPDKTYYTKNDGEDFYTEVDEAKEEDLSKYYERIETVEYVLTEDTEAQENKVYYQKEDDDTYTEVQIRKVDPQEEGYLEKEGDTYVPTEDTEADPAKTYYVMSEVTDGSLGYEYDGEEQPVTALRGHWIRVTFDAKIKDGCTVEDVRKAFAEIKHDQEEERAEENIGNAPVVSAEDHIGIPNDASYTIGVANEAGIEEDVYGDRSNTVTVKPLVEEPEEEEKKQDEEVAPKGKETQKTEQKSAAAPSNGKVSAANTGDETRPGLWVVMMILAAAVAGVCIYRRRKGNA